MANLSAQRKIDPPRPDVADEAEPQTRSTEELVRKLMRAGNSNEIAAVIGLLPIRGRSGPKVFY